MDRYRFHILGIPHTISVEAYSACAFTQKVVRLCRMMTDLGHEVIHYGNEKSDVHAEHVTVTTLDDLERSYPGHDWGAQGFPTFSTDDPIYEVFRVNAATEIRRRQKPGDFLLCPFGNGHRPTAESVSDLTVVESGIGYPGGTFAPFRVFESYCIMHVYQGMERLSAASNSMWYDVVIPNAFDPGQFIFSSEKEDYLLALGRVGPGKGTHMALQIAEATGHKLIIAGPGSVDQSQARTDRPISEYVEHVGVVGPAQRARLLSRAGATICASTYLEPFCGVQIESMLSGTPVISTDWGAFAEFNPHGKTGYRCRTFEQFEWAVRNIGWISPHTCRSWAIENFSLKRIAAMYEEYFWSVARVASGEGWYAKRPERDQLGWLDQWTPGGRGSV